MKKTWVWLPVISLALAACSQDDGSDNASSNSDGEMSGEITVWVHPYTGDSEKEDAMWDEIVSDYESEHGVTVNLETIPWANRDQKVLTALAANNGPDVFYAIPDQMPQYADVGMLLELDSYLGDYDLENFVESSLVSVQWQDKTYGLPILQEAYTLFYNTDIVEEIGEDPENLPETWEEFTAWSEKAVEAGYYAHSFQGGGSMNGTLYPFLWQAGGEVLTADDEVKINEPEAVEAFELINTMYQDGWIPEDSITAMAHNEQWFNGEIMAITGSGNTLSLFESEGYENFAMAAPLTNQEQVTYGTTGMFVAPSNTDNPEAAAEFIKHVTNEENQRRFNSVTKYIPTREAAKDIFDGQPHLEQIASYTQYALPGVIHPKGRDIMPSIQAELQSMMAGEKSPQEAADAAAAAIENVLAQ